MEYTPERFREIGIPEKESAEAALLDSPAIIRRLRVTNIKSKDGLLFVLTDQIPEPLVIPRDEALVFGTESVKAIDYCRRVIERNDMIDAVMRPRDGETYPIISFWVRIEYAEVPIRSDGYSKKEDGQFALRAKAGEKAERRVARDLRDQFGHVFPAHKLESPGFFEIRYAEKKSRKPDLVCSACGLTFEVKKRNKDRRLRVSHSVARPFAAENRSDGWHAFVFADMEPRYVRNDAIAQAITNGGYQTGRDQHDSWADIDASVVAITRPPNCTKSI